MPWLGFGAFGLCGLPSTCASFDFSVPPDSTTLSADWSWMERGNGKAQASQRSRSSKACRHTSRRGQRPWRLRSDDGDGRRRRMILASRWRVSVMPLEELQVPGLGRPQWFLELMRVKAGVCAEFLVRACDDEGRLDLSSRSADGSHSPRRSIHPPEQPIAVIAKSEAVGVVCGRKRPKRQVSMRQHPVAFLRNDLSERNIITCAEAMNTRMSDGSIR